MGVMSCNRNKCENILCDTFIDTIGYICNDCKSEFKDYLNDQNKNNLTEGEIRRELRIFIDTIKGNYYKNITDINTFFDKYGR
jgi:hypothetical protein